MRSRNRTGSLHGVQQLQRSTDTLTFVLRSWLIGRGRDSKKFIMRVVSMAGSLQQHVQSPTHPVQNMAPLHTISVWSSDIGVIGQCALPVFRLVPHGPVWRHEPAACPHPQVRQRPVTCLRHHKRSHVSLALQHFSNEAGGVASEKLPKGDQRHRPLQPQMQASCT